ncbi:Beta-fructofuranosidase, partial [Bertholletia excelsa]
LSCVWLLCLSSFLLGHGVWELEASHHVYRELQTFQSSPATRPYRTAFHFQPPKNWMNDGAGGGNKTWGHSTSVDLINWIPHKPAIVPSQLYDSFGCWSGSITFLPGDKPVILYTGIINSQNWQVQNLAVPNNLSDSYLVDWVKSPRNPLMAPTPQNQIDPGSFRDPSSAWLGPDGTWRVIIGNGRSDVGMALLYRSRDFVEWTKAENPLHFSEGSKMWECPDFFPVSKISSNGVDTPVFGFEVKRVLKASFLGHDYYATGTYKLENDIFILDKGTLNSSSLRYDYGNFYASKTFFDSSNSRRILWGWVLKATDGNINTMKGWAGLQSFPRKVWLDKAGNQLTQWPVKEILKLRTKKVEKPRQALNGGSVREISGITAAHADVDIAFEVSNFEKAELLDPSWTDPQLLCALKNASVNSGGLGPFGLLVLASEGMQEYTAVFFRIFKDDTKFVVLMCSDQSRSSKMDYYKPTYGTFMDVDPVHQELSMRTLVNHSIVESFGGEGKACITARVYPTMAIGGGASLYAFNNGSESVTVSRFRAWSMKKAQIN